MNVRYIKHDHFISTDIDRHCVYSVPNMAIIALFLTFLRKTLAWNDCFTPVFRLLGIVLPHAFPEPVALLLA